MFDPALSRFNLEPGFLAVVAELFEARFLARRSTGRRLWLETSNTRRRAPQGSDGMRRANEKRGISAALRRWFGYRTASYLSTAFKAGESVGSFKSCRIICGTDRR
jgi:hypothetical protein